MNTLPDFMPSLALPAGGALAGALLGLAMRAWVLPSLVRFAEQTETRADDIIVGAVRGPLIVWAALAGLYLGSSLAGFDARMVAAIHQPVIAALVVSVSWALARIAGQLVQVPQGDDGVLPSARILSTAATALVFAVGLLVALQTIGVSVAPVLTALGVGGLAVGLALRDTLANLFAGFQILVSRQLRPGDFVRLASGEEGFVSDITWRNTTIRQLSNNIVIVPNAVLAQSVAANFTLPHPEQAVLVEVGVSYDEDLSVVERVTIDVARDVQRTVTGAVRQFDPFIRFHTFADSAVMFTVILRGQQFTDRYLIMHEFVRRLHARYRHEGIVIPYPQRTLHYAPQPAHAGPPLR